jgi:hypothetical protein
MMIRLQTTDEMPIVVNSDHLVYVCRESESEGPATIVLSTGDRIEVMDTLN